MGHEPFFVDRVAMKAAAQLIVHSAARHLVQSQFDHVERAGVLRPAPLAQQKPQRHRGREFGFVTEPAMNRIARPQQVIRRVIGDLVTQPAFLPPFRRDDPVQPLQLAQHPFGAVLDLVAPRAVGLGDRDQHAREPWHPVAVNRREIGPAVKRFAVGRQKDRHRPPAAPGHHLHGVHINRVQVGTLFAVDLDVDEVVVHQLRDGFVLERFPGHYATPMTCPVTYAQQYRLVFPPRAIERFFSPRVPINRIMRMVR